MLKSRLAVGFCLVVVPALAPTLAPAPASALSPPTDPGEEQGPMPSDWFIRQRAFPSGDLDPRARLAAFGAARRFAERVATEGDTWTFAGPDNIGGRITDLEGRGSTLYAAAA